MKCIALFSVARRKYFTFIETRSCEEKKIVITIPEIYYTHAYGFIYSNRVFEASCPNQEKET